ncbi:hypothetical protein EJ04DRAFT_574603 [Polyplosphaeria fusca]|uniref:Uncharacterized protein n=1 Tax=Polyplosphaeria fusca TaxID=682080 RepID=A0A9P4R5N7_9PLEO|nr:hypothetical protein EJ04DRAFT_574603 [Polyplosphaeria fusca]
MAHCEHAIQSPFEIPPDDVRMLQQSRGFQVLRSYLASSADFCTTHAAADESTKQTWLLHRDILHALTMPIVELYKGAQALAQAALCTQKPEDLETAFGGQARNAFLWLECFVSEDEDWCRTRGCPACATTATLSTESHIRLTIAASLLSTADLPSPTTSASSSTTSTPTDANPPQLESETTSLPPLPHILPALRAALAADPFWGPTYWPAFLSRASILCKNIQELIAELVDLRALVSSPAAYPPRAPSYAKRSVTAPIVVEGLGVEGKGKGMRLKKSKMAKRQLRMREEEEGLLRRCALQWWGRAGGVGREVLGVGMGRARSLTCP